MSHTGVRAEVWEAESTSQRLGALQSLENELALQDGREPCLVSSKALDPQTRGEYFFDSAGHDHINLNTNLVDADIPFQAVETLYHEDRHAHQHQVSQHPELADDPQQLNDWRMSEQGGYMGGKEGTSFSEYRWQPVEKDANEQARLKTDELYQDELADTEQYPEYRQAKMQELSDDVALAQYELGEDYAEEARQSMIDNYEYNQAQTQGAAQSTGLDQGEGAQSSPEVDTSRVEDEGYSYGYSY